MFKEEAEKLVLKLSDESGKVLNIIPISTQFTLNTICESAMGVKLSNLGDDGVVYRKNIYEVGRLLIHRALRPWLHTDALYKFFGGRKELDIVLQPVHYFTKSIIKKRKANFTMKHEKTHTEDEMAEGDENVYFRSKKQRRAMMDTLLQAQANGLIDDDGIIEETDTFTFEGHDTTSAAMTFTLLLLAHQPEAQNKIFEEIEDLLHDKVNLTIDHFNQMEYLDRAVKECLRIYPPVPFIGHVFAENFTHDGFTHSKGSTIDIHIYDIHRDPEIFPDPEKFDPDRFLAENTANRNNFAFLAFSAGMRNCIGQRFAMLEIKVMVTKIIQKFQISPITTRDEIVFIGDLVLRSRDPIKMKFNLRKK